MPRCGTELQDGDEVFIEQQEAKEEMIQARTVQLTGFYGNPYYAAEIGLASIGDNTSAAVAGSLLAFC